jgi:hypothetical protein
VKPGLAKGLVSAFGLMLAGTLALFAIGITVLYAVRAGL